MDATYRADLRELNELNFARFDAKLEQRFAQADAKLEQRLAQVDAKIEGLKSELIKWMFVFWTGSALVNVLLHR